MKDVLVIGSGPAGISAALTLQAAGYTAAVATLENSALRNAGPLQACYGLDGVSGEELYQTGIRQATRCGIEVIRQQITGLTRSARGFAASGPVGQARCVLLATGRFRPPVCPGFAAAYLQKGVYFRAEEDGFHCRGRMVGVLGTGAYALAQAQLLAKTARTVTLFTDGKKTDLLPGEIGINRYAIAALAGGDRLEQICFENGAVLNLDALFIADRIAGAGDLAAGVGLKADDFVPTDANGMTPVAGLFAAGDCTGRTGLLQEQIYDGYRVGRRAAAFLQSNP